MIDKEKKANNQKMDELVEKLGYMDYRDALACNKYIIEAKRSGDYNQIARAQVLEVAFKSLNRKQMKEIDQRASQAAEEKIKQASRMEFSKKVRIQDTDEFNQAKLEELMGEFPELAELYQDSFMQQKLDKELDRDNVMRVHERFDKLKDPDNKIGKI